MIMGAKGGSARIELNALQLVVFPLMNSLGIINAYNFYCRILSMQNSFLLLAWSL